MKIVRLLTLALAFILPLDAHANDLEDALRKGFAEGKLDGLHAVLVRRNGETLAEVYFDGEDEVWGSPIGLVRHGPDTPHDLRSVTKSVVGLLYGIALAEGLVPPPDAPLLAQFPGYGDLASPERDKITVGDALTMRMGTAWDETLPYTDPRNSEIGMERAPDRIRFVLEQPMVAEPGTAYVYSGGATAVLAALIARGAGMPVDRYAAEKLFAPLGITDVEWVRGVDGTPSAASGLRLSAPGLARIGEMILGNGRYEGKQIVPSDWLETSFVPRTDAEGLRYGYHWWISAPNGPPWIAAFGNGGQRLTLVEPLGLLAVIYAGNYNKPDQWQLPVTVITDYIAPTLR